MKKYLKILISLLCASVFSLSVLAGCGETNDNGDKGDGQNQDQNQTDDTKPGNQGGQSGTGGSGSSETVDYVAQLKLDMTTDTKKQEVTVRNYIDGDTTHFNPVTNSTLTSYNKDDFAKTDGYIKARYLAVDTPESTGDIEKWGKTAAKFTRSKLESAEQIIIESDDGNWNIDSTGERYTLWIWYRPQDETDFRNLNVEILQNGLARASNTANNRYGEVAFAALNQARAQQLCVYAPASVKDENFYEGEAIATDLKTLRYYAEDYVQKSVRVEGVVVARVSDGSFVTAYIEEYDEATKTYFGMQVFLGTAPGGVLNVFSIGNRVNVVGAFTYFETGDTYQISGITVNEIRPRETDSRVIETNKAAAFTPITGKNLTTDLLAVEFEEVVTDENGEKTETTVTKSIRMGEAILGSSVSMSGLTVTDTYTTATGDNAGAISLTCTTQDGETITVRTEKLTDENGNVVTADRFMGKTINVKGIVDKYTSSRGCPYQVKVHRLDYIEIVG